MRILRRERQTREQGIAGYGPSEVRGRWSAGGAGLEGVASTLLDGFEQELVELQWDGARVGTGEAAGAERLLAARPGCLGRALDREIAEGVRTDVFADLLN